MRMRSLLSGVLLLGALGLVGCATEPPPPSGTEATSGETTTPPEPGTVHCDYLETGNPTRPVQLPNGTNVPATGTVQFTIHFDAGDVTLTMDRSKAPCTVNSFESLVEQGFYEDTLCHRTFAGTMFQCGDPSATGRGGPGYRFADEITPDTTSLYPRGVVAMGNAGPNTNGSQFFLVYNDLPLDGPKYTTFATMDDASMQVLETLNEIGVLPQDQSAPAQPIHITSVTKLG